MEFIKGDIVENRFAGEHNPRRLMVYLGKSTIRQGRYRHTKGTPASTTMERKFSSFGRTTLWSR